MLVGLLLNVLSLHGRTEVIELSPINLTARELRANLGSTDSHLFPFAPSFLLKVLRSWFQICIYISSVYFTCFCYSRVTFL